jgi:hypothetical protein
VVRQPRTSWPRPCPCLLVLVLLACLVLARAWGDIILSPLAGRVGPVVVIYVAQGTICRNHIYQYIYLTTHNPLNQIGAELKTSQYVNLMKQIQSSLSFPVWVGIPQCSEDICSIPGTLKSGIDRVSIQMTSMGMRPHYSFYAGHSLGGMIFIVNFQKNIFNFIYFLHKYKKAP